MGFSESAIDDIISQAQDACVLEQLSAINCASFTDSVLPTQLESRFRNLKSFPPTKPNRTAQPPYHAKDHNFSTTFHKGHDQSSNFSPSKDNPHAKMSSGSLDSSPVKEKSHDGKKGVKAKSKHGSLSPASGSGSSHTSEDSSMSSLFKQTEKEEGRRSKQKPPSGSLSSPLGSSNSPSPPRKTGCFWCSPKKKKSKENWGAVNDVLGWDKSDELLSDLGSFSSKQQQKILKKAMKEQQKISREAEKIVQWAKQASARMNVSAIEDDLSDDD